MDGARRRWDTQNTRRMDSARSESICRHFINGSCRLGTRCNYRHEWQVIPSTQICRHFQKGGCWYGERCRFLHVLQSEIDAAVAGRRSSVPTVSSSVAYAAHDRRGSEPTLLQAEVSSRQDYMGYVRSGLLVNISNPQHRLLSPAAGIAEEQLPGADSHLTASQESNQDLEVARPFDGRNEQETASNESVETGAAAAAAAATSGSQWTEDKTEAFLRSKNMTCGICMDKVFERVEPRTRVFGILPNCNHSFCLQCIKTWRKTKDLGPDVVKTCPQCRVRSAFYVPNKYWVEGRAKESVIAAFKDKFSRKSCSYYARYGCCPFKTECLYRHSIRSRRRSFPYPAEDEDDYEDVDLLNLFIAMTLLGGDTEDDDDDDYDFDFAFYDRL